MPKRKAAATRRRRPTTRGSKPARTRAASGSAAARPATRPRSAAAKAELADEYYRRLHAAYPDAHTALHHHNAYQLLVATILSAQCTDARVNMVTPALFAKYPTARELAGAERGELEQLIKSTGFFRSKAKSLSGMATAIVERFGGEVPRTMEELTSLPGVGRKTANVILGNAFHIDVGIVVDTHVSRLAQRLGLTRHTDPVKIEQDLMALVPRSRWTMLSHLLIEHGRRVCVARTPRCEICVLNDLCPSSRV